MLFRLKTYRLNFRKNDTAEAISETAAGPIALPTCLIVRPLEITGAMRLVIVWKKVSDENRSDRTPCRSCPPKLYGGTERIVSYLTEELVDQGHDVTLFASGD